MSGRHPSGKWVQMSDDQLAREQARFARAVARQQAKDEARPRTYVGTDGREHEEADVRVAPESETEKRAAWGDR
jgi:hypothetical protein